MKGKASIVISLLAAVLLSACTGHRPTPTIRNSAEYRFKRGDYIGAAEDYQEIVARYPGDVDAQHMLGLCLLELEQTAEAQRALEIAHDIRPDDHKIAAALAEAMYRQGDEAHLFAFLRGRADSMKSPDAYLRLAEYSLKLSDPDSAKLAVNTAIELDEGRTVEPYLAAADLAERLGDLELAVRRLRQAYGINPHDIRVVNRLRAMGEVPGPTIALPPGR